MNVLNTVRERLRENHPHLRYTEAGGTLVVEAPVPGGFDVSISEDLIVGFGGWHEHFHAPEQALECFAFGFTDRCRLRVTYRGDVPCRWTLESLEDGEWVEDSTTGALVVPFWRAERTEYLQNSPQEDGA